MDSSPPIKDAVIDFVLWLSNLDTTTFCISSRAQLLYLQIETQLESIRKWSVLHILQKASCACLMQWEDHQASAAVIAITLSDCIHRSSTVLCQPTQEAAFNSQCSPNWQQPLFGPRVLQLCLKAHLGQLGCRLHKPKDLCHPATRRSGSALNGAERCCSMCYMGKGRGDDPIPPPKPFSTTWCFLDLCQ